uniref:F-box domain protein n=1 Tax=Pithovirus LCPAC401 TaxID=2506595 RepID=A0A481ZAN9_9VIRU|nr:MAG: F-box domain protein [Pithovirus LCPAC401]
MSDVTAILRKLRLSRNNLNDLSSDEITYIFKNLTVKEISTLCGISNKFNSICKRESLWRLKILNDYGISESLRGKTWRDSARLFSISDMIDMGKEWVNGMTYKELLDEADSRGKESLLYLYHIKNEHFKETLGIRKGARWFYINRSDIEEKLFDEDNIKTTGEQRVKIANIMTREFGVIAAAIAMRYYSYPNLPYSRVTDEDEYPDYANYTGNVSKSTKVFDVVIDELFNYMPYIMEFSHDSDQWTLYGAIYPETHH